jgi:hypothetical protein
VEFKVTEIREAAFAADEAVKAVVVDITAAAAVVGVFVASAADTGLAVGDLAVTLRASKGVLGCVFPELRELEFEACRE